MYSRITSKGAAGTKPDGPGSLWRNRDYLLLWSGQTVSSFGTQASQLAFPLLVLFLTHSPVQAGLIGGLRLLPYIFLSLPAGAWVDRWDRKRLMIRCDIIRAMALGSIPLAYSIGHLTLAQLYVTSLIEGSLYVFFSVAETSCLPHVVSKEQIPTALGQNQAAEGAANLLGPSIGGVLFALNTMFPFLVDAISYAISFTSLLFVKTSFQKERKPGPPRRLRAEVFEGLNWLWHQPLLRYIAFRNCGITFSYAGSSLVVIVLAQKMHASSGSIGVILAVGGIGHIVGSFLGPIIQKRYSYKQIIITLTWMYLIWWSLYLVSFTPLMLGITTAVLSMNRPIQNIANSNCRMMLVPDEMRGRVNSVNQLISWSAIPLGGLVTGTLLQLLGPTLTIAVFSACFLTLGVLTTLNSQVRHAPSWAELRRIHDLANAAEKMHSLSGIERTSEHTWVGIDRYLVKLPGRDTGQHEIYAFNSLEGVAEYTRGGHWTTGVESYKISVPNHDTGMQEVFVYQTASTSDGPVSGEEWTDIDRYKIKLPDRYKDTHEAHIFNSPISLVY